MVLVPLRQLLCSARDDEHLRVVVGGRGEECGPAVDEPVEPVWPALAAFILAYTVSRAFAAVYECAVDTLFVCAVVDKDEYGGVHMSAALRDALELDDDVSRRKSKSFGGRAETRMI